MKPAVLGLLVWPRPSTMLALAALLACSGTIARADADDVADMLRTEGESRAEAMVVRAIERIGEARLEEASTLIEEALAMHPNFRLAHLLKGDILLARVQPLSQLGDAPRDPQKRAEGLRAEARARLQRHLQQPPAEAVPRYLLQLREDQTHALVVDGARSTLYVYANDNGILRYVTDYYISLGVRGVAKRREGDRKTPIGVYRVQARKSARSLGAFYGVGAWTLDYPNEWDRSRGRRGHGIWVHGTPPDTYSRPPYASDGCVVMTNSDLAQLDTRLQAGKTTVVISDSIDWITPEEASRMRSELAQRLEAWRRDVLAAAPGLRTHYRESARPLPGAPLRDGRPPADLALSEVSILLYPGEERLALIDFVRSVGYAGRTRNERMRQYWQHAEDGWKIVYEGPG